MTQAVINERYRVIREIGRGAQGATYLAVDRQTGRDVALKELDFAGVGSWDGVSVFEREVAVLGGLDHPNIPHVLDSFRLEGEGTLRMFLVQEFVEGEDLRARLQNGELFDEARLRKMAAGVLDMLAYLHGNSPPVIHRDIKPANLVERHDGSIVLVDFGAAQGSQRGEAVIGTTGYMPAEQLMGRAQPSSDLFALGATLIHLATRKHPSDLGDGLGIRWREYANLSESFSSWIDKLVEPMPEDRFPTALAAARALDPRQRSKRADNDAPAAVRHVDDLLAETRRAVTLTPNGRYELTRSKRRLSVKCKKAEVSATRMRWAARLLLIPVVYMLLFDPTGFVANLLFVGVTLAAAALFGALSRRAPAVVELNGHERGIDIVWAGEEVVQRVLLPDISGPDLIDIPVGKALVLWTRSGERLVLDRQFGGAADARIMRAILQAWLVEARRKR